MTVAPHVNRISVSPPLSPSECLQTVFFEVVPLANDDIRRRHKVVTDVVATFWRDILSLPVREMLCLLMHAEMFSVGVHKIVHNSVGGANTKYTAILAL